MWWQQDGATPEFRITDWFYWIECGGSRMEQQLNSQQLTESTRCRMEITDRIGWNMWQQDVATPELSTIDWIYWIWMEFDGSRMEQL